MAKLDKCFFCGSSITNPSTADRLESSKNRQIRTCSYECQICGSVLLDDDFLEFRRLELEPLFSSKEKQIVSICLRNEHERRGGNPPSRALTLEQLGEIVKQYRELDALEKMDKPLEILDKTSSASGREEQSIGILSFHIIIALSQQNYAL